MDGCGRCRRPKSRQIRCRDRRACSCSGVSQLPRGRRSGRPSHSSSRCLPLRQAGQRRRHCRDLPGPVRRVGLCGKDLEASERNGRGVVRLAGEGLDSRDDRGTCRLRIAAPPSGRATQRRSTYTPLVKHASARDPARALLEGPIHGEWQAECFEITGVFARLRDGGSQPHPVQLSFSQPNSIKRAVNCGRGGAPLRAAAARSLRRCE